MIEEAKPEDYPRLKEIGMSCFENNIRLPGENYIASVLFRLYFSKWRFQARQKQGTKIYVLKKQKYILGFYEMESSGLLSSLYVDPCEQHQGCGSCLLGHALTLAKQLRLSKVRLDASQKAVSFYEKMGFKQIEKKRFLFGICMVPMEKQLNKT